MSLRATKPLLSGTSTTSSRTANSPIRKIAQASSQCSVQGQAYAQCIFAAQFGKPDGSGGSGVERGMCQSEFRAFKDCVQEKMKRRW